MNVSALSLDAARRSLEAWIRKLSAASASPASAESRVEDCRHDREGNLERGWNASAPRAIAEPRRRRVMNAGVNILSSRLLLYLSTHGPCRPCSPASPHLTLSHLSLSTKTFCLVLCAIRKRAVATLHHTCWEEPPCDGDCQLLKSITQAATGAAAKLAVWAIGGSLWSAAKLVHPRAGGIARNTPQRTLALGTGAGRRVSGQQKDRRPLALSPLGSSIR